MSNTPCDRSALTEALLDGRLGPPEEASAHQHLKVCPACADLHRDLTALRGALRDAAGDPLPLEHQRARLALLRRAAAPSLPRRRPVWQLAVAVSLAPMFLWAASSVLRPSLFTAPVAPAAPATTSPSGTSTPQGATAPASVAPAASAAPAASSAGAASEAAPGPAAHGPQRPAPSGPAGGATGAKKAPGAPTGERATHGAAATAAAATTAAAAAATTAAAAAAATTAAATGAAAQDTSASRDFADAMGALARGDFGASARKLEGFAAAHPGDARAEEALYLEAIALDRAGRSDEARAAARRYLAAYPGGSHRAQAARIAEKK